MRRSVSCWCWGWPWRPRNELRNLDPARDPARSARYAASQPEPDLLLLTGLAAAYGAFAITFRGPPHRFWQRMTATGAALEGLALVADPELRRTRLRARDIAGGFAAAAGLYGIFQAGDRLARKIMPKGAQEIGSVYALRQLRSPAEVATRLALVIAPAEELFWRGFLQRRLARRAGVWREAALGAMAYGGAHAVTANLTLTAAAGVAGAYWAALAAAGFPLGALIVSHMVWDVWIFLLSPTDRSSTTKEAP
jgi:membrane protease YdiL (CAAX protease family)